MGNCYGLRPRAIINTGLPVDCPSVLTLPPALPALTQRRNHRPRRHTGFRSTPLVLPSSHPAIGHEDEPFVPHILSTPTNLYSVYSRAANTANVFFFTCGIKWEGLVHTPLACIQTYRFFGTGFIPAFKCIHLAVGSRCLIDIKTRIYCHNNCYTFYGPV